jgi:thiol-disulfide isomerase/thioredoxin
MASGRIKSATSGRWHVEGRGYRLTAAGVLSSASHVRMAVPVPARETPAGIISCGKGIVMEAHWRAPAGLHFAVARLPDEGALPSLEGATGWLNSAPLTTAGLRGSVVLVGFWTYTCVNWLRQLPYLRAWSAKYSGRGLAVIGVHTPEYSFEHDADIVRRAVREMQISYPVSTDNNFAVWRAFGNNYWPAL